MSRTECSEDSDGEVSLKTYVALAFWGDQVSAGRLVPLALDCTELGLLLSCKDHLPVATYVTITCLAAVS